MFTIIEMGVFILSVVTFIALIIIKNQIGKMSEEERQDIGVQLPHYTVLKKAEQKSKTEEQV